MNGDEVRRLEEEVAKVLESLFEKRLSSRVAGSSAKSRPRDPQLFHFMAKAAISVYEATERSRE